MKRAEVERLRGQIGEFPVVRRTGNSFSHSIVASGSNLSLIAEIKMASPSKGRLTHLPAIELARCYAEEGARAISVLTDETFFAGSPDFFAEVRTCGLPLLRKDFVIDTVQVFESAMLGADALLLIAGILDYANLLALVEVSMDMGIEPVVEVHDRDDLRKSLDTPARIIGVNNRCLYDFSVDIRVSLELGPLISSDRIRVSESGVTSGDLGRLSEAGFQAVLVGENLVTAPDVRSRVREYTGKGGLRV